jgi:hypothetical protein
MVFEGGHLFVSGSLGSEAVATHESLHSRRQGKVVLPKQRGQKGIDGGNPGEVMLGMGGILHVNSMVIGLLIVE